MTSLADFLLRQIADDEAAARAVPPLDHNFDMGGNRQDERWIFDRTLPSSADGMGNWSKHRHDPSTAEHFKRWDPARVLAECEAKRRIVERHGGEWPECVASTIDACPELRDLAAIYADHPDYRQEWRP